MAQEELFVELLRNIQSDYQKLDLKIVNTKVEVEELMLPMEDGILLKTYIYKGKYSQDEKTSDSFPVIVQRSPYYHALEFYHAHGENLAKRGFAYIVQFCRGTGPSQGIWEPNVNERNDGIWMMNWLNQLTWVDRIGYWGDSYLALTGWCMADVMPEKVSGMYLGVYGTDRFVSAYEKGLFRHDVLTSWAMENAGYEITADYEESCKYKPHIEVDEKLWGKRLEWYRDWITAVKDDDSYWQQGFWKMLRDIPSKVKIPIFLSEGWYDHHLGSALKTYSNLSDTILDQSTLCIGGWNHFSMNCIQWMEPKNLQNSEVFTMVKWFEELLVKKKKPQKEIRVYIIGRDEWKSFHQWPVAIKENKRFYFTNKKEMSGGFKLITEKSPALEKIEYVYDPENPVYSLGGESMLRSMEKVGSLIQPQPDYRKDVITFISEPFTENTLMIGCIQIHMFVSSSCEDTAFTGKVMEIKDDEKSVNIRTSITRIGAEMEKQQIYKPDEIVPVTINMWDIAWEIQKNSRLRVDISSSDFPQYAIHSNTAGSWSLQSETKVANQTIYMGGKLDSYVEIPII